MDIAARAIGADLIEKTVTLDRTTRSCEHVMSLEPSEMGPYVKAMRDLDVAMGSSRRILTNEEREKRLNVQRSAFLIRPVAKGETIKRSDFDFRRPGTGVVRPDSYAHYMNRLYSKDLSEGHMLVLDDLQ